jgi:hypothetical protein
MIRLSNAYDAREFIKAHGGSFEAATKSWVLTDEQWAELEPKINRTYSVRLCKAMSRVRVEAFAAVRVAS